MGEQANMGGAGDGASGDAELANLLPGLAGAIRYVDNAGADVVATAPYLIAVDIVARAAELLDRERKRLTKRVATLEASCDRLRKRASDTIDAAGLAELYRALEEDNHHIAAAMVQRLANTVAKVTELETDLADLQKLYAETKAAFDEAAPDALRALHKRQVDAQSLDVRHGTEMAEKIRAALRREPVAVKDEEQGEAVQVASPTDGESLSNFFHRCWTSCVGAPKYDKGAWKNLVRAVESAEASGESSAMGEVLAAIGDLCIAQTGEPATDSARPSPDRAAWLLHPVSSAGRQTIAASQYEELRREAVALRANPAARGEPRSIDDTAEIVDDPDALGCAGACGREGEPLIATGAGGAPLCVRCYTVAVREDERRKVAAPTTAAHRPSVVELRVARDSASAARVDAEIAYRRASRDHADAAERALRGAVDREARANEALAAEEARGGLTQRER